MSRLETLALAVPEAAVPAYAAALERVCGSVGLFRDEARGLWLVEGVRPVGRSEAVLAGALALAEAASGIAAIPERRATEAEGWLARTRAAFPEQLIGRRFAIRGSHVTTPRAPGRITLVLDAGLAFGSGEHGSTRGCLLALERLCDRRPRRILDLGTGSGILAMAAARLLRRPMHAPAVLATDIAPDAVRVAAENARRNGLGQRISARRADGWRHRAVHAAGPYDLVFANILARPLAAMARDLATGLAPGGVAVLAGLLSSQARAVLAAHRRQGLHLAFRLAEGAWTTLVLSRRSRAARPGPTRGGR